MRCNPDFFILIDILKRENNMKILFFEIQII